MQLMLQMLQRRTRPAGAHSQAQGIETSQNPHLSILWQIVYAGDLLVQAHAEACRAHR